MPENDLWIEIQSKTKPPFLGTVQVHTDMIAATLRASTTNVCLEYYELLIVWMKFKWYLEDQSYNLVGLLPVSIFEISDDPIKIDFDSVPFRFFRVLFP